MKKKAMQLLLCALVICTLLPVGARADMGPKPSVQIALEGLDGELCYGTLLSERASTGPASVWDGTEEGIRAWHEFDRETFGALAAYEDPDGYYFLQWYWRVDETERLSWTYYPPSRFKILLYFPESGTFLSSGIYERYAFDSYFTVDVEDLDGGLLVARQSYDYTGETLSLAVRIVLTILLELGVALLFGFRAKRQILTIAAVNVVTQVILNVLLSVINYRSGYLAFFFAFFAYELVVLIVEAIVFSLLLRRNGRWCVGRALLYALAANVVSCAAGFGLAHWIPGIF